MGSCWCWSGEVSVSVSVSVSGAQGRIADDRGRDDGLGRPSLRTEQADFRHSALQLVVTYKKIGKP